MMRVLVLSNHYPPYAFGGQEQRCSEVAASLARRGHSVYAITSDLGHSHSQEKISGVSVQRSLHLQTDPGFWRTAFRFFFARRRYQLQDVKIIRQVILESCPDVIFVWGMWNLSRSIPWMAEKLYSNRVVYNLSDYWPALPEGYAHYWQTPSGRKLTRLPKKVLGRLALGWLAREPSRSLEFKHPICVSRAVRDRLVQEGVPVGHARIIHSGIDVERFARESRPQKSNFQGLKLLYAGRVSEDKGVHTAIQSLAQIDTNEVTLDIVGKIDNEYEARLRNLVSRLGLEERIRVLGYLSYNEMPALFPRYDGLIFPSEWDEPFSRTVLEAMAAGLVVVGTTTGGTGEILIEGETGLTFPPGDAEALASQIRRLINDSALCWRLAENGNRIVRERFTFNRMVDEIEAYLLEVIARTQDS